jgi:5-formyltetrahydrofolate cyclo-ligase
MNIETAKALLRRKMWTRLETEHVAKFPLPCFGRIPNFVGSESAADKVRLLSEWKTAKIIFANPDFAQQKVREYALADRKILIMASPKLKHGYVTIDPKKAEGSEEFASTIRGAFKYAKTIKVHQMPRPELIVEGSVAVDKQGNRLGKGHGYGDTEIRALKEVFGEIPVVTTVHDAQVVEAVPYEGKDEKITVIVTPTRIIRVSS